MYGREHDGLWNFYDILLFLLHSMTQQRLPGNEIELNSIINEKY